MKSNIQNLIQNLSEFLRSKQILTSTQEINQFTKERRGNFNSKTYLVVLPQSTQEVAEIVKCCVKHNIGIVPQGGNTGLVGGSVSSENQVIVNLKHLNKIRDFDPINHSITVESGAILLEVQKFCDKNNLLFPLDLASRDNCCIGGNLSTNAGGLNTIKYGTVKNFTLGLEVVLANGKIVSDLNQLTKRNIGPDYKNLFIGGEGTLGIITCASFKLEPKPKHHLHILLQVESMQKLVKNFLQFKASFNTAISSFEIMNNASVFISQQAYPQYLFPLKYKNNYSNWYALLTLDFYTTNDYKNAINSSDSFLKNMLKNNDLEDFYISKKRDIWQFREAMSNAQTKANKINNTYNFKHDLAIPLSQLQPFVEEAKAKLKNYNSDITTIIFGHAGDHNIHFNVSIPKKSCNSQQQTHEQIKQLLIDLILSYKGNFSAEHGIGLVNKGELNTYYKENQIHMFKLLKKSIDPLNIFNANKIIDS